MFLHKDPTWPANIFAKNFARNWKAHTDNQIHDYDVSHFFTHVLFHFTVKKPSVTQAGN
jgi:hypothetical protein